MYGRPPKPRGEMPDTPQAYSQSNGVGQAGANKLLAKYNCFFFKNFTIVFFKNIFHLKKEEFEEQLLSHFIWIKNLENCNYNDMFESFFPTYLYIRPKIVFLLF